MSGNEVGRIVRTTVAGGRDVARGAGRAVGTARQIGGANNPGLMRLLDVHTASSAGDTLVIVGLLTTVLYAGTAGEARARVALFLLVTMVPYAVLAPLLGPLLDRFRHGRRFALSASLGLRAVLAWLLSIYVHGGIGLYVTAFGVVLLSRVHGTARSAALARLVPPSGLRLSQAAARATVFATVAGAAAAGVGFGIAEIGPQWPLRLASLIFLIGGLIALTLPPLADTDGPEVLPRPFGLPWRSRVHRPDGSPGETILGGRLIAVTVLGSGGLRLLYGFLLLFLAFAIRSEEIGGGLLGVIAGGKVQLILVAAAFGLGTIIATAVGTAVRVTRPVRLQAVGVVLVTLAALWATVRFSLLSILVLCLFTAIASGLAKVAVDAVIQERVPERDRPNAFARTETLLMLIWLAGAAIGLVPTVDPRLGVAVATLIALVAMATSVVAAWRMRGEVLSGHPTPGPGEVVGGVLLQPGSHARPLPPAPVSPVPTALPAPPTQPPSAPQGSATTPAVIEASAVEGPVTQPAGKDAPVTPAASDAPAGYHVFRPSPPQPPPSSPPPPGAPPAGA